MADRVEVKRFEDRYTDGALEKFECLGCGKTLGLWWNGGELDRQECCGYVYEAEHVRTDIVVYGPPEIP